MKIIFLNSKYFHYKVIKDLILPQCSLLFNARILKKVGQADKLDKVRRLDNYFLKKFVNSWVKTRSVIRQQIWTNLFHNILKSLLLQDLQNFKYRSTLTYKLTNYHDILLHYTLIKKGWLVNVKTTKNLKIASRQNWVAHYFNAIYSTYSKPLSPSIGLFMFLKNLWTQP